MVHAKVDCCYNWAAKRYDPGSVKQRRKSNETFSTLSKKMADLEKRIKKLEKKIMAEELKEDKLVKIADKKIRPRRK